MNITQNTIISELSGSLTELTEDEIALLFDYRTSNEESQREIQELIKNIKA